MQILQLQPRIFWDVNHDELDEERHADFIIRRVFDRGWLEDLIEVLAFYPERKIKKALLTAPTLPKRTLHFAAGYYHLRAC